MERKLYRTEENKMIAGVAGGLAEYFDIDPIIVRVTFVLTALLGWGFSVIAYIVLWIVVPKSYRVYEVYVKDNQQVNDSGSFSPVENDKVQHHGKTGINVFAALALILFGIAMIIHNYIPYLHMGRLWPLFLILLGIAILIRNYQRKEKTQEQL